MALKSVEHFMVVDNDEAMGFKTYKKTELIGRIDTPVSEL